MEVSQDVALRGPGWLALYPPAGPRLGVWLPNDVPACRGLAVAWLKRGANAVEVLESGVPATVLPAVREGAFDGGSDDRGRSAQGLAHGSGDQRGGGAA